jgi:hypothetical protein
MPVGGSSVELFQEGDQTESTVSDEGGNYQISVYPAEGVYDLRATNKKMGNWRRGIELRSGERVKVDLIIRNSISISGTIRMLDNSTPVTSMPIELVKLKPDSPLSLPTLKPDHFDEVYSTTLSNLDGDFQFVNLLSGEYIVGSSTLSVELGVKKKSCIMKFHGFGNDFSRAFGAG